MCGLGDFCSIGSPSRGPITLHYRHLKRSCQVQPKALGRTKLLIFGHFSYSFEVLMSRSRTLHGLGSQVLKVGQSATPQHKRGWLRDLWIGVDDQYGPVCHVLGSKGLSHGRKLGEGHLLLAHMVAIIEARPCHVHQSLCQTLPSALGAHPNLMNG